MNVGCICNLQTVGSAVKTKCENGLGRGPKGQVQVHANGAAKTDMARV